jgi:hypothetical protein
MPHQNHTANLELCYLDAANVVSPLGVLASLQLLSPEGTPVGTIEGVLVEATERRVRYYDVRINGSRQCVLPADQLGQVEAERKAIRLRDGALEHLADVDLTSLRAAREEERVTTVFSINAA